MAKRLFGVEIVVEYPIISKKKIIGGVTVLEEVDFTENKIVAVIDEFSKVKEFEVLYSPKVMGNGEQNMKMNPIATAKYFLSFIYSLERMGYLKIIDKEDLENFMARLSKSIDV